MNINHKGESCRQPIVLTRTMLGMLILQGISTTTMRGTQMRLPRLNIAQPTKPCVMSAKVRSAILQGTFARPQNSEENNLPLQTLEPQAIGVAQAKEGLFYDDIFASMLKRRHGVMWKPQVKACVNNGALSAYKLTNLIINGKYRSSTPQNLMVYYPKKREVRAIPFRDRIFQGYLNDKYIYKQMTRSFIYGNMASQDGKGTDKTRDLLKRYLWNYYTHNQNDGYVLQIDISKYYQSILKDKALELFQRKLTPRLYKHVEEILNSQYDGSFYAGSQLIQLLGIAYLDSLDHFIKEQLHIRYYIRYQDDFILIHKNKEALEFTLKAIEKQLNLIGLQVNHKKTRLRKLSENITFLGFVFTLQNNGKVYMRINPQKVKAIRRKLKKHPQSLPCYKHYFMKGKSFKLYSRLEKEINNENLIKRDC